jgi:hypothetical protein
MTSTKRRTGRHNAAERMGHRTAAPVPGGLIGHPFLNRLTVSGRKGA